MKAGTIFKVLGILALGMGVLVLGSILFSLAVSILHVAIPLAVIFGIGFVAYHLFLGGGRVEGQRDENQAEQKDDKKPEALPAGKMSDEDAARLFDQHREAAGGKAEKKLGP